MIFIRFVFVFFFFVEKSEEAKRNDFPLMMPDLPSFSSNLSLIRRVYPLTDRFFQRISLQGGPFNVQLYQNPNLNENNSTSVDVQGEESFHSLIHMEISEHDQLRIRRDSSNYSMNETNVTLIIIYDQLNELEIDGRINVHCLNPIESDRFQLVARGTGSIRLKLNVNRFDAYLHSIGRVKFCGRVYEETTIQSLGLGDVQARNLLTRKMNLISSGIGNVYVTASEEISVTLTGIGNVFYRGPLKQQIKTGLGNLFPIEEKNKSN